MNDIMNDIKEHLIAENICKKNELKFNLADSSNDVTVLWLYGGYKQPVGTSKTIQVKTYSTKPEVAKERIQQLFDALISREPNRISTINNKKMRVVESQPPFFEEKDTQNRFVWVFNITVTAF